MSRLRKIKKKKGFKRVFPRKTNSKMRATIVKTKRVLAFRRV